MLNENLEEIGDSTFRDCKSLERISLSSTITKIGCNSFNGCRDMETIILNEALQTIGRAAFANCTSLETIRLPSSITEIGGNAFYNCQRLRVVKLHEAIQKISINAFAGCTALEHITIPPTITEISERTFDNCQNLREVELHEGLQKIASNAFWNCSSLERFTFPSLTTRLETIIQAGETQVEDKVDNVNIRGFGIRRRGSKVFIFIEQQEPSFVGGVRTPALGSLIRNWKVVKETLGRIDRLLTYYELREATTLLELAMWKAKINQAEAKPPINRNVYRIDIPGLVKDAILQYLNFRV